MVLTSMSYSADSATSVSICAALPTRTSVGPIMSTTVSAM